jgi:putative Holliday junction resolvase
VDYGSKRIGLALSDEAGTMGFPYSIISNTPRLVDEICALIAKENVGAIIIGDSRNFAGYENPIAKVARAFGDSVAHVSQKPVFFESEIFTSVEARRMPEKELKSRAPSRSARIDASAAALILTSYLSRTNHE